MKGFATRATQGGKTEARKRWYPEPLRRELPRLLRRKRFRAQSFHREGGREGKFHSHSAGEGGELEGNISALET